MQPYIGVTGFTKPEEVQAALDGFPVGGPRQLMVGVLVDSKTLRGIPLKSQRASRYPRIENIAALFLDDPRVINLVHFHAKASESSQLYDDLLRLREMAGPNLHGFQLNIAWPNFAVLELLQTQCLISFVLQIGAADIADHFRDRMAIARRVKQYDGCIDAVLLDSSSGTGRAFDPEIMRSILCTLNAPGLGLGVAGSLGPETLGLIESLLAKSPNLSIDAEDQLHTPHHGLDIERVRTYLADANMLFTKTR